MTGNYIDGPDDQSLGRQVVQSSQRRAASGKPHAEGRAIRAAQLPLLLRRSVGLLISRA